MATVGTVMSNLENVLDDDLENTCATIGGVNVGSGWQVSVRLGRLMDRSHQACVVMDNTTYLAVATVAGALNISLYREGVFITDVDNWSVVGVDAIGYGDKQYILLRQPPRTTRYGSPTPASWDCRKERRSMAWPYAMTWIVTVSRIAWKTRSH